ISVRWQKTCTIWWCVSAESPEGCEYNRFFWGSLAAMSEHNCQVFRALCYNRRHIRYPAAETTYGHHAGHQRSDRTERHSAVHERFTEPADVRFFCPHRAGGDGLWPEVCLRGRAV